MRDKPPHTKLEGVDLLEFCNQPTRKKILQCLNSGEDYYVSKLAVHLRLRAATVHEHVRFLVWEGLVVRKERQADQCGLGGVEIYLSLTDAGRVLVGRLGRFSDKKEEEKDGIFD